MPGSVVAFAADRVYSLDDPVTSGVVERRRRLSVSDLAGATTFTESVPQNRRLAWDATRVAWSTQPCQAVLIAVKPLGERAGDLFTDRSACPVPDVSLSMLRRDAQGRASVKVACPASPPLGCIGGYTATLGRPAQGRVPRSSVFAIPPGDAVMLPIELGPAERAAVAKAGRGRIRLTLTMQPRRTVPTATKQRVRVAHITVRPPRR